MQQKQQRQILVCVSGASGSLYAKSLLDSLRDRLAPQQVSMVFTANALSVWAHEIGLDVATRYPFRQCDVTDFSVPFVSGSARVDTMIIVPASMGIIARIAQGVSADVITRAADVMLKEKRRLIVVPRESPYSLIHLRNMEQLLLAGAHVCPASPHFYARPSTLEQLVGGFVDRLLDLCDLPTADAFRWGTKN